MNSSETNNLCSAGGDMLAYLYNEIDATDRESFERHLEDCGDCIDGLAELSQSRYPVYEWKRTQFDPLPTPRVVLPFEVTTAVSWFDKFRTTFSLRPAFAFGGMGAAMIVAVIGGYFILTGTAGDAEVAREVLPSASPTGAAIAMPSASVDAIVKKSDEADGRDQNPKVVKASTSVKSAPSNPKFAPQPKRKDAIPVMSSIEDDEDDSLRLADIFEEIGTSE